MSSHILFVGRQPNQYAALWRHLGANQTDVSFAASQSRALKTLDATEVDVIILDASTLRTPAGQLCRMLRQQAPTARLVLIAKSDTAAGIAYDYHLTHPVSWRRLLNEIEEAQQSERRQVITQGPFVLDLDDHIVIGPAGEGRLTPKLFGLLRLLMLNANQYVSRLQIMREVWNTDYVEDTRTLDVHMTWLRKAVEPEPKNPIYVRTKRGLGYVFLPTGEKPDKTDKKSTE